MKTFLQKMVLMGMMLIFFLAAYAGLTRAAVFWPPNEEVSVTNEAPVKLRNLFVMGQKVEIRADEILKDLFVMGMNIEVSSRIENNVYAGAQDILISGEVGGNIFALGSTLRISGKVDGDIFAMGSKIVLEESAVVQGEIFAGTTIFHLKGQVMDDVSVTCNNAYISGTVLGKFSLKATEAVEILDGALIQKLSYKSPFEAIIAEGAEVRAITYTELKTTEQPVMDTQFLKGFIRGMVVIDWLASFLIGFLLIFLFRKPTCRIMEQAVQKFGISVAFGLTFFVGVPLVMIVLFLLVVGYKLALISGIFALLIWSISSTLAGILTGVLLQYWIVKPGKALSAYVNWIAVLLGISIFKLLLLIPVLGWLARLGLVCAIIGAILLYIGGSLGNSASKTPSEESIQKS